MTARYFERTTTLACNGPAPRVQAPWEECGLRYRCTGGIRLVRRLAAEAGWSQAPKTFPSGTIRDFCPAHTAATEESR